MLAQPRESRRLELEAAAVALNAELLSLKQRLGQTEKRIAIVRCCEHLHHVLDEHSVARAEWTQNAEQRTEQPYRKEMIARMQKIEGTLTMAQHCANEGGCTELVARCYLWHATVKLQHAKLRRFRAGITLVPSKLNPVDLLCCESCLRPIRAKKKKNGGNACQFCRLITKPTELLVSMFLEHNHVLDSHERRLVEHVLWGTRRLDLAQNILNERDCQKMAKRILHQAKTLVNVNTTCCTRASTPQEIVQHWRHRASASYVAKMAAFCFRKSLRCLRQLKAEDSKLYDDTMSKLPGSRFSCKLCRLRAPNRRSHIISNGLLAMTGEFTNTLQLCLVGEYGIARIIGRDKATVKLCCADCELLFSKYGEALFACQFRKFISDLDRSHLAACSFQFDSNDDEASPIYHTVVGIALRAFVDGVDAQNEDVSMDMVNLRQAMRSVMLASGDHRLFQKCSENVAVVFTTMPRLKFTAPGDRPMYVMSIEWNKMCLVHLCLHDVHFLVFLRVHLDTVILGDAGGKWQRILFDTLSLTVDLAKPAQSRIGSENNMLYDAELACFSVSIRPDLIQRNMGDNHRALAHIPPAIDTFLEPALQGAIVRLPECIVFTVPNNWPTPSPAHGRVRIEGQHGHICHVTRWKCPMPVPNDIKDVTFCVQSPSGNSCSVTSYLCIKDGTVFVINDVDLTDVLKHCGPSRRRPRLVYAVKLSNPIRRPATPALAGSPFEVKFDVEPWKEGDHKDLFEFDKKLIHFLRWTVPDNCHNVILNSAFFKARLHQQCFPAVNHTLIPLPDAAHAFFKDLYDRAEEKYLNGEIQGEEALTQDMLLILSHGRC